jgi:hypothetical protein
VELQQTDRDEIEFCVRVSKEAVAFATITQFFHKLLRRKVMSAVLDLFRAARVGDSSACDRILCSGIDPNCLMQLEEGFKQPCFFIAALNGHLATVEVARQKLFPFCFFPHHSLGKVFWRHGADLRGAKDSEGETVLGVLAKVGESLLVFLV